ncbi:DUF3310 domain-containing protein [Streptomyces sp. H39-S7]|uniref:DUF3310 domain-containing protein n=1 Tax=Streptomyces sp. H39-S7 TaxID=3004357 RepID=UPI0022AF7E34|nr:DUF3310 domain-containing protein [Streptomyces sp. H39-S7]MCZ4119018.1 DUF3310 domain-containing protein [Streptomyces sp. H39-S7]
MRERPFFRPKLATGDSNPVNHPSHYTWLPNGFEVIDMTEHLNFNLGNAIKYIARAGRKSEDAVLDLEKAQWYLAREIQRINSGG